MGQIWLYANVYMNDGDGHALFEKEYREIEKSIGRVDFKELCNTVDFIVQYTPNVSHAEVSLQREQDGEITMLEEYLPKGKL